MKVVNATPWAVRSSAISAKAPLTAESAVSIGEAANAGLYPDLYLRPGEALTSVLPSGQLDRFSAKEIEARP